MIIHQAEEETLNNTQYIDRDEIMQQYSSQLVPELSKVTDILNRIPDQSDLDNCTDVLSENTRSCSDSFSFKDASSENITSSSENFTYSMISSHTELGGSFDRQSFSHVTRKNSGLMPFEDLWKFRKSVDEETSFVSSLSSDSLSEVALEKKTISSISSSGLLCFSGLPDNLLHTFSSSAPQSACESGNSASLLSSTWDSSSFSDSTSFYFLDQPVLQSPLWEEDLQDDISTDCDDIVHMWQTIQAGPEHIYSPLSSVEPL